MNMKWLYLILCILNGTFSMLDFTSNKVDWTTFVCIGIFVVTFILFIKSHEKEIELEEQARQDQLRNQITDEAFKQVMKQSSSGFTCQQFRKKA